MDITQQGIITLLKSAVLQQALPLPEGFRLEDAQEQIARHHMTALIYEGAVLCGISRRTPLMRKLFQGCCKGLLKSEGQMRDVERIFAAFDENGIDHMPLKGCKMKALYPRPELRAMGDADILIRMEQYERIIPVMESLGFQSVGESDHELMWQSPALKLELHKRVIPSYNEDFYAYFGDGWRLAKLRQGTRFAMNAEDEFIYLFTHFAKHYRDGGIGCRHVVDLWVYTRAKPGMDEAYIRAELKKLQLLRFYDNIRRLLQVWFADASSDDKTELISEYIFASGSWGQLESRALCVGVRDAGDSRGAGKSRLVYVWSLLFPSVRVLRHKYTVLQKVPYLLPAVWLLRPFYKLLFERDSLKQHRRRLGVLTRDNLQTRRELLSYMDIDYNF